MRSHYNDTGPTSHCLWKDTSLMNCTSTVEHTDTCIILYIQWKTHRISCSFLRQGRQFGKKQWWLWEWRPLNLVYNIITWNSNWNYYYMYIIYSSQITVFQKINSITVQMGKSAAFLKINMSLWYTNYICMYTWACDSSYRDVAVKTTCYMIWR